MDKKNGSLGFDLDEATAEWFDVWQEIRGDTDTRSEESFVLTSLMFRSISGTSPEAGWILYVWLSRLLALGLLLPGFLVPEVCPPAEVTAPCWP